MTNTKKLSRLIGTIALAIMFVACVIFAFAGCDTKEDKDKTEKNETTVSAQEVQNFVSNASNTFEVDTEVSDFAGAGVVVKTSTNALDMLGDMLGLNLNKDISDSYTFYTDKEGNNVSMIITNTSAYTDENGKEVPASTKRVYMKGDGIYTEQTNGKYIKCVIDDESKESFNKLAEDGQKYMGDVESELTKYITTYQNTGVFTKSVSGEFVTYKMSATVGETTAEMTIVYNGNTLNSFSMNTTMGTYYMNVSVEKITEAPDIPEFTDENTITAPSETGTTDGSGDSTDSQKTTDGDTSTGNQTGGSVSDDTSNDN